MENENIPRPFPEVYNLFSTRQTMAMHVPWVGFNVRDAASQLTATREARLRRARRMAPVLIGEQRIPVTVMVNPVTGHPSYHGVLMEDPQDAARLVMLYFKDTDGYFAGFQRCVAGHWGRRLFFDDLVNEVPVFLDPVKMGMSSSHSSRGDYPGRAAIVEVFHMLAGFEDHVHIDDKNVVRGLSEALKAQMKIAFGMIIIVFGEAMRFRSIYNFALHHIGSDVYSTRMSDQSWDRVRSWGKISEYVLKKRRRGLMNLSDALDPGNIDMASLGFPTKTLADLIGPIGELTMCKIFVEPIINFNQLVRLSRERGATNFIEPNFIVVVGEEQGGGRRGRGRGRGRGRAGRARGGRAGLGIRARGGA